MAQSSVDYEYTLKFDNCHDLLHDVYFRLTKVPVGTEFLLKDLYTGIFWNSLTPGLRKKIGLYLTSSINMGLLPEYTLAGKASGQQIYKKIAQFDSDKIATV